MPTEITMPQQSDTMTEGTVVKWVKKEGDKIKGRDSLRRSRRTRRRWRWRRLIRGLWR